MSQQVQTGVSTEVFAERTQCSAATQALQENRGCPGKGDV